MDSDLQYFHDSSSISAINRSREALHQYALSSDQLVVRLGVCRCLPFCRRASSAHRRLFSFFSSQSPLRGAAAEDPAMVAALLQRRQDRREASSGDSSLISGSSVTLYAAGQPAASAAAAVASTTTDANGFFSLPAFTCPTPDSEMYFIAKGGNSGGGSNS